MASTCTKPTLASDVLWSNLDTGHAIGVGIGCTFALGSAIHYMLLSHEHHQKGTALFKHTGGIVPDKLSWMNSLIRIGIWITGLNVLKLCVPELSTIMALFEAFAQFYAFYCLWEIMRFQFGDLSNLTREDGSGTLQRHKPFKIWASPPCCCVWVWCYPWMEERVGQIGDFRTMWYMMLQSGVVIPLCRAIQIATRYEQVSSDRQTSVDTAMAVISVLSLFTAIQSNKTMLGIVAQCETVRGSLHFHRARQLAAGKAEGPPTSAVDINEESLSDSSLEAKSTWITMITAGPALLGLIVSMAIKDDHTFSNGDVLLKEDRITFWSAMVTILLCFAGSFYARSGGFNPEYDDSVLVENFSRQALAAENEPAFVLEALIVTYERIISERRAAGKDINFGIPVPTTATAYMTNDPEAGAQTALEGMAPGAANAN